MTQKRFLECSAKSFLLVTVFFQGCASRGYNQSKPLFPVVSKGEYYLERVVIPGEDIISAAQRVSPSRNQGLTSYTTRGWLACSNSLSGQASCSLRIGRLDAMLSESKEVMAALNRRLPTPKKPNGESSFEWKIWVPFEARMQRSNGEENTYAVSFGANDLGEGETAAPQPPKQPDRTYIANAVFGVRVEPASIIPIMEKLKEKAKIPKGQGFLEADLSCDKQKNCSLSTTEGGMTDGAVVSEKILQSEGLLKGIETELPSYGKFEEAADQDVLYKGRIRLFEQVEQGRSTNGKPRRNTVALATFYKIEFLD